MELTTGLATRFGAHRVVTLVNPLHPEQSLVLLYLELAIPVTILMTNGLSNYKMPVSEKWKDRPFNELYFCLPTYWDLEDTNNPNFNWVFEWLFRLETFVKEKQTWFGPGHTIPCGNPPVAISPTMKQEYFIFLEPMLMEQALSPLKLADKTVYFLAITPLYGDELDYKMGKGTHKLVRRFYNRKIDERIDDYRANALSSRMRFF